MILFGVKLNHAWVVEGKKKSKPDRRLTIRRHGFRDEEVTVWNLLS